MDDNRRDWKTLPAEVLQIILKLASLQQSKIETCNLALVCKTWVETTQTVAYSDVTIKTIQQFRNFHNLLVQNPNFDIKVKTLELTLDSYTVQQIDKIEVTNLLASLLSTCIPNLEVLKKRDSNTSFPPLNNLLSSQLRHLRRLEQNNRFRGYEEFEDYSNCVLLMKNRLENIYLTCSYFDFKKRPTEKLNMRFQCLHDNLYQFNNLVEITIETDTNEGVQVLEYIVESCKSLKKIDFSLATKTSNVISIEDMSKYVPRPNIKSLSLLMYGLRNDYNLLLYIMHKFQQLKSLYLDLQEDEPQFDVHFIAKFLDYVSTIDKYSVTGLTMNHENLLDTIGNLWQNKSEPGSENFHLNNVDYYLGNIKASLEIMRGFNGGEHWITLKYSANDIFDWRSYTNFIEKSGKFIGTMRFKANPLHNSVITENFFPYTFLYCPNLRKLHLDGYILKHFIYSELKLGSKSSIDELFIQHCEIQNGMLEQLSLLVHKIKKLRLSCNGIHFPENKPHIKNSHFRITMPHTEINHITFEVEGLGEKVVTKVFVSTDEKGYLYVSDVLKDEWICEEECTAESIERHVYISCLTKPVIENKRLEQPDT